MFAATIEDCCAPLFFLLSAMVVEARAYTMAAWEQCIEEESRAEEECSSAAHSNSSY